MEKWFIEFYNQYYKKIFNYLYRHLFHMETAEDITSEVFMKALKFIREKHPQIQNPSAWIYKIATNELFLHHRKHKGKKTVSLDQTGLQENIIAGNTSNVEKYMDFMSLREVLIKLKPVERVLIELYYFEKRNYREIAEITRLKEVTLRSRMHRILKKIKKLMN